MSAPVCPYCGGRVKAHCSDNPMRNEYQAYCDGCYDGAEDSGPLSLLIGCGDTRNEAIADFLDRMGEMVGDLKGDRNEYDNCT